MLIYVHGFNSAPHSFKARLVGERMRALARENKYFVPALPHRPSEAMTLLSNAVERNPGAALIGSSLGGFYATWLAERYGLRTDHGGSIPGCGAERFEPGAVTR